MPSPPGPWPPVIVKPLSSRRIPELTTGPGAAPWRTHCSAPLPITSTVLVPVTFSTYEPGATESVCELRVVGWSIAYWMLV